MRTARSKHTGRLRRGLVLGLAVVAVALGGPGPASAQGPRPVHEVKAGCLYSFLLFIANPLVLSSNPAVARTEVVIGLVGQDSFGEAFRQVEGRPVGAQSRLLRVRRFGGEAGAEALAGCDLVFLADREASRLRRVLASLRGKPVITVGETAGFLEAGGMVNLVVERNHVRWEINRTALREAGLVASAQLLRNALRLVDTPAEGMGWEVP